MERSGWIRLVKNEMREKTTRRDEKSHRAIFIRIKWVLPSASIIAYVLLVHEGVGNLMDLENQCYTPWISTNPLVNPGSFFLLLKSQNS